ncbi:integrase [Neoroseomonas lacus]|uniref:Integrase n=1 Tax=Neoroseomonas lacus TaxID=287609 RepID=A0A917NLW9_9PROT|nr:integrase [Neoroseomonas lacus]
MRRLTGINHPWTDRRVQVERMSRTIKDAAVKRRHDDCHYELRRQLDGFVAIYNIGRRLKRLRCLTPYGFIGETCANEPCRFNLDPHH